MKVITKNVCKYLNNKNKHKNQNPTNKTHKYEHNVAKNKMFFYFILLHCKKKTTKNKISQKHKNTLFFFMVF